MSATDTTRAGCASLADLLDCRAQQQWEEPVYTFLGDGESVESTLTYGELETRAKAVASRLLAEGCEGTRAILLYPPGLDFLTAFFGCIYAKVIAVPAYPPHRNRNIQRLQAIIQDARPAVVLSKALLLGKISEGLAPYGDVSRLKWIATDAPASDAEYRRVAMSPDDIAFLQYTSGSTGAPKGVMLTHRNLLHNASLVHHALDHQPGDSYVSWLPTFHDMGFMAGVLQPLYGGFRCVQMAPAAFLEQPLRWLQAISRYRATTSGGPNFAYELCINKIREADRAELDLSSWSVAFNGAEPVRADTLTRFRAAFAPCGFSAEAFYPCYGLAEATLMVSGSFKGRPAAILPLDRKALEQHRVVRRDDQTGVTRLVGCGRNLLDQEMAIVDPESLTECKRGDIGEIWVRGPSVAKGYWNRAEESAHTFGAYIAGSDRGPFLRTGDLGVVHDDLLFIAGRLKDLLIVRGQNHYPQDIELTVERCDPQARPGGGAAFSVDHGGEERLVIVQEVNKREEIDADRLFRHIRRDVAEQHELAPYAIELIPAGAIAKTSSGKIQRHACKAAFLENRLNPIASWRESAADAAEARAQADAVDASSTRDRAGLTAWFVTEIARRTGVDPSAIDQNQPITAYGLDSLGAVEIVHKIQTEFGVEVPMTALFERTTIANAADGLIQAIESSAAAPSLPRIKRLPRAGRHVQAAVTQISS